MNDCIYPGRPIIYTFGTYGNTLDEIFTIYATKIRDTITTTTVGSLETVFELEPFSERKLNETCVFPSFDIEDLYQNIPIAHALEFFRTELIKNGILGKPLSRLLTKIIKTFFTDNQLQSGDRKVRKVMQINGIGMGWHSAPILAESCIFHTIGKHMVNRSTNGSGFYSRLLDDGLVILL